jgi:hypothetical protein
MWGNIHIIWYLDYLGKLQCYKRENPHMNDFS